MVVGLPKGGRRVLLADDDAVVQEVVRCAAAKVGHQVTAATTGARAFELAVSMQPDLIVLDIQFPDADGRDVLAKLKRDPRTVQIPVIVWSCRPTSDSDSRIALALGAEDYVEKSDVQGLIRKLERVLLRFERSG
jgi:CheY-like chemotaxis protein